MGRKVNPIGARLKVNRDWDARWYAEGNDYVELLQEDRKVRQFVKQETARAGVSRIEIERQPNLVGVTIHTVRPGLIIGRKGERYCVLARQSLPTPRQKVPPLVRRRPIDVPCG